MTHLLSLLLACAVVCGQAELDGPLQDFGGDGPELHVASGGFDFNPAGDEWVTITSGGETKRVVVEDEVMSIVDAAILSDKLDKIVTANVVTQLDDTESDLAKAFAALSGRLDGLDTKANGIEDKTTASAIDMKLKMLLEDTTSVFGKKIDSIDSELARAFTSMSDLIDQEATSRSNAVSDLDTRVTALEDASVDTQEVKAVVNGMLPAGYTALKDTLDSMLLRIEETETVTSVLNDCGDICAAGQFLLEHCHDDSQHVCAPCEDSSWSPGGLRTRCIPWSTCADGEYETAAPSATNDRECAACSTCGTGTYETQACGVSQNRVCSTCTTCGSNSYMESECTSTGNAVCKSCQTCDKYARQCSATANAICCSNTISSLSIGSHCNCADSQLTSLTENVIYASNRACYTVTNIHSKYLGAQFLRGDNDKAGTTTFTTPEPVSVYVALDGRYSLTGVLSGFTEVGEKLVLGGCHDPVDFWLFKRSYPAGTVSFTLAQVRMAMFFVMCDEQ